jgi:hypothetical protein
VKVEEYVDNVDCTVEVDDMDGYLIKEIHV